MSKEKVHRKRILSPRTIKFIAFAIAVIIQLAVLLVQLARKQQKQPTHSTRVQ